METNETNEIDDGKVVYERLNRHGLTSKQERFCREYILDHNATQAAIRTGYSPDSARQIASENLTKPNISKRIEHLEQKLGESMDITRAEIRKDLQAIIDNPMATFSVRLRAIELKGKMIGAFNSKDAGEDDDDLLLVTPEMYDFLENMTERMDKLTEYNRTRKYSEMI